MTEVTSNLRCHGPREQTHRHLLNVGGLRARSLTTRGGVTQIRRGRTRGRASGAVRRPDSPADAEWLGEGANWNPATGTACCAAGADTPRRTSSRAKAVEDAGMSGQLPFSVTLGVL